MEMIKNPRLVITDNGCFGYIGSCVREAGRDLSERDFKKWYTHIRKRLFPTDSVTAYGQPADDDTFTEDDWIDYSLHWFWNDYEQAKVY